MKVVIQCCATKNKLAGSYSVNGRRVKFVAHPELHQPGNGESLCRPDDVVPATRTTWREHLLNYNACNDNPDALLPAADLYSPLPYRKLRDCLGAENLYVLSAGWGLVRGDFLLPDYDITFSHQAERWKRRTKRDSFCDYIHLSQKDVMGDTPVYFFGGKDYLPLFYKLTRTLITRKVVYVASAHITTDDSCDYIRYGSTGTNWHYRCIADFLGGAIAK